MKETSISTKSAEGCLTGVKFSIIHALLYAPFTSKESSLANNSSRAIEYIKQVSRASVFFCFSMTGFYGL